MVSFVRVSLIGAAPLGLFASFDVSPGALPQADMWLPRSGRNRNSLFWLNGPSTSGVPSLTVFIHIRAWSKHSIPDVSFVKLHSVLLKQQTQLVLKRDTSMVFGLIADVFLHDL